MGNPKVRTVVISGRQSRAITTAGMPYTSFHTPISQSDRGKPIRKTRFRADQTCNHPSRLNRRSTWKRFPCKRRIRGRIGQMMQTDRKATAQNQQVLIAPGFYTRVPAHMLRWLAKWLNAKAIRPLYPPKGSEASSLTRWNSSGSTGTNLSFGAFPRKIDQGTTSKVPLSPFLYWYA